MSENVNECANCGKGEDCRDELKRCVACKTVWYCSEDCKLAHLPQHEEDCREAVELMLFEVPPLREDCPICMIPLPFEGNQTVFYRCCGVVICGGCTFAFTEEDRRLGKRDEEIGRCPFCRAALSGGKYIRQLDDLVQKGNLSALTMSGIHYSLGEEGYPKDLAKARDILTRAGELGSSDAHSILGILYLRAEELRDFEKSKYYHELAAIGGDILSRTMLGKWDEAKGNLNQACKHYMIAAICGDKMSMTKVQEGFKKGAVTKDEYANTLRSYQRMKDELMNDKRKECEEVSQQ